MSTWISAVSATAGIVGVVLAALQYVALRRQRRTDEERLAALRERLMSSRVAAQAAADGSDIIVQRSKDPRATRAELGNLARGVRGELMLLVGRLRDDQDAVETWVPGGAIWSNRWTEPADVET